MVSHCVLAIALAGGAPATPAPRRTESASIPRLEFRIVEDEPLPSTQEVVFVIPGESFTPPRSTDPQRTETLFLRPEIIVSNSQISEATVRADGRPGRTGFEVFLRFTPEGAKRMEAATLSHKFKRLAVLLDGKVLRAPKIQSVITDQAVITTNTEAEARRIAAAVLAKH